MSRRLNWQEAKRLSDAARSRIQDRGPLTPRALAVAILTVSDYRVLAGLSIGRPAQRLKLNKMYLLDNLGRLTNLARSLLPATIQPIVRANSPVAVSIQQWRERAQEIRWLDAATQLRARKLRTLERLAKRAAA